MIIHDKYYDDSKISIEISIETNRCINEKIKIVLNR